MRIYRCDRCGKEMKKPFLVRFPVTHKMKKGSGFIDDWMIELCDPCKEGFLNWIDERSANSDKD